jgi:hypothetical protein
VAQGDRPGRGRPRERADPAQPHRRPHGPPRRHQPATPPRPHRRCQDAQNAPTYVKTYLPDHHAGCRREPARRADSGPSRRPTNRRAAPQQVGSKCGSLHLGCD